MTEKKDNGRPRIIQSPEEMDRLVVDYVATCKESGDPLILTGMILHMGLSSKQSFYEYMNYDGFSDSVKKARLLIESEYEKRMVDGSSPAGAIFALKNFEWKDKHPTELDNLQCEKLKKEMLVLDETSLAKEFSDLAGKLPN